MRFEYYVALTLTIVLTFVRAQEENVEALGNKEDIKWNLFQLFVQTGGIIAACFPISGLTGIGIPVCTLSAVAAFVTIVALTLKLFDGLLNDGDEIAQPVLVFLHSAGLRFAGQRDGSSMVADVAIAGNQSLSSDWSDWSSSSTAAALRELNTTIDFSLGTVHNSIGVAHPDYCFVLSTNEAGGSSYPLAAYQQTVCFSQVFLNAVSGTRCTQLPPKALPRILQPLKNAEILKHYLQAYEFAQSIYSIFGPYADEFIVKVVSLARDFERLGPGQETFGFIIADQIDGQTEQLFRIELARKESTWLSNMTLCVESG
ncbi:LADA_0D03202g1_1 [Lachancea dasiensis]|uniref:LADA_0D03202g1_1 n=1 Tax=Lachancea dasiensis TaxID=1072105 RepID=A0A1G4J4S3_9SACH|nr:LADA_0D03202g1_1 [Lachancea dasiensis]